MGAGEALPRIFLGGLEGQGDALTIEINVKHLDGDLVSDLDDLGRVIDVLPRQLGNVDQAVNTAQIDERAEVDDGGHDAFTDLALLKLGQEGLAHFGLGLLEVLATGEDHVVAVLVELEDLGLDLLADVRGQIADTTHLDERCRQEATQTDVDDAECTLTGFDDSAFDNAIGFLDLLDVAPSALVLCTLLGQNQTAFLVFLGDDKGPQWCPPTSTTSSGSTSFLMTRGRDDTLRLYADVGRGTPRHVAVSIGPSLIDALTIRPDHHHRSS